MSEEKFQAELLRRLQSSERIQEKVWKAISEVNNKQTLLTDYQARANGTLINYGKRIRTIEDASLQKEKHCPFAADIRGFKKYMTQNVAVKMFTKAILWRISVIVGIIVGIFGIVMYLV